MVRLDTMPPSPNGRDEKQRHEKKDHQAMTFSELEADPEAGPVLQRVALEVLKEQNSVYVSANFHDGLDPEGFLTSRINPSSKIKPSEVITRSSSDIAKITRLTKEELKK